jgi:hypothetical protein
LYQSALGFTADGVTPMNVRTQIHKYRNAEMNGYIRAEEQKKFFFKYCRKHFDLKKVRLEEDKSEISFSFILF